MMDTVLDGRHIMGNDEREVWALMWKAACDLSAPLRPEAYFDARGLLHVTLPRPSASSGA